MAKSKWYKIGEVEYSTDFGFFLEHQIHIVRHEHGTSFNSRLESKTFITKGVVSEQAETAICHNIFFEVLQGKHGKGEFVN
jgi:hypothetical protein